MTTTITDHLSQDIYANNPSYGLIKAEPSFLAGRKVEKLTYRSSLIQIQKIGNIALAALVAVATLFIALCFRCYRQFWKNALGHFSDHIVYQDAPEEIQVDVSITPNPIRSQKVFIAQKPQAVPPPPLPPLKFIQEVVPQPLISQEVVAQPNVSLIPLQQKISEILKKNPEYQLAVDSWNRSNVSLVDQITRLEELKAYAFGTDKWDKYFGMPIGKIPHLPSDIYEMLNGDDHVNTGNKIKDTHVLVLVPKEIDHTNKDLQKISVYTLGQLAESPKTGSNKAKLLCIKYEDKKDSVKTLQTAASQLFHLGKLCTAETHWALMTKKAIPYELAITYWVKGDSPLPLPSYNAKAQSTYYTPNAVDVAACCLLHFAHTGERLFDRDLDSKSILCNEFIDDGKGKYHLGIGDFINNAQGTLTHLSRDSHLLCSIDNNRSTGVNFSKVAMKTFK